MRPMVREEMKTFDIGTSTTLVCSSDGTTAQTQQLLNTIPTGTSSITRIGKKVLMKALQIRGILEAGSTGVSERCAILLVYVRSNNQAATPTVWADILNAQSPISMTNRDNASKYKILRRWDYQVIGNATTAGQQSDKTAYAFDEYVVFKKPLISTWTSASVAGTIAEFEKGSLHICCVGNATTAGTLRPAFSFRSRLYYCECDGYMF